jgi:uncharacterized protein (TIGR02466 family)
MKTVFQVKIKETYIVDPLKKQINKKIEKILETLDFTDNYDKTGKMLTSDEGVINTNNFLKRYGLTELENIIIKHTYEYCKDIGIVINRPLSTFMSWCTKIPAQGTSTKHSHNQATLVAVYYFNCTDDQGNLRLYNPMPYYYQENRFFDITPADGKLIIFPGWIEHEVQQNNSKIDRYSIAVNIEVYDDTK